MIIRIETTYLTKCVGVPQVFTIVAGTGTVGKLAIVVGIEISE
jgi:hypothetical protein